MLALEFKIELVVSTFKFSKEAELELKFIAPLNSFQFKIFAVSNREI